MHAAVIERIGERRDPTLVALAKYMHKGLISKDFMGIKISKKNMVELADKIFERLELQAHITEEDEEEEEKKETVVKDMKTELQHFIESSWRPPMWFPWQKVLMGISNFTTRKNKGPKK